MTCRIGNPTDWESFLTWEALTDVLSYDPATGEFRWVKSSRQGFVGRIAGCVDPTKGGYRYIRLGGRSYLASRLAWLHETKAWPSGVVDHINGDRDDNRWENLRDVSVAENARNRSLNSNSTTGAPGVHWDAEQSRYVARLAIKGVRKYLGAFATLEEAVAARKRAEIDYYAEMRRDDDAPKPAKPKSAKVRLKQGSDLNPGMTQAILMRLVSYDPATGEFRWLETTNGEVKVGPLAGKTTKNGYRQIGIGGRAFYGHRLAWLYMTGKWPVAMVDHKDGNPANNAWSNLRAATAAQNNANRIATPGKSGVTGVYWHEQRHKWVARASKDNKFLYLGLFDTVDAAKAARKRFDDFHRDGFVTRESLSSVGSQENDHEEEIPTHSQVKGK